MATTVSSAEIAEVVADHAPSDSATLRALALIACSAALGGQFVIFGVPLFLRQAGAPSSMIGLFFLVALPFVGRFVWAPLVDRYGSGRVGHYRVWVLGAQTLMTSLLIILSLLDPRAAPALVIACLVLLAACLGTLSLALEALTVRLVPRSQLAKAITWQRAGAAGAGLLLGAGVIWVFGGTGWSSALLALAALQAAALLLLARTTLDRGMRSPTRRTFKLSEHVQVFGRPGIPLLFVIAALATLAADLPYAMKTVVLTDAGFDTETIGLVGIVLGNAAGLLAALASRPLVERLGGYRALVVIAALSTAFSIIFVATGPHSGWRVASYVVATGAIVFAASIAVSRLLYERVDPDRAATQVSSFEALSGVLMIAIAGAATGLLDSVGLAAILTAGALSAAFGGVMSAREARKASR